MFFPADFPKRFSVSSSQGAKPCTRLIYPLVNIQYKWPFYSEFFVCLPGRVSTFKHQAFSPSYLHLAMAAMGTTSTSWTPSLTQDSSAAQDCSRCRNEAWWNAQLGPGADGNWFDGLWAYLLRWFTDRMFCP